MPTGPEITAAAKVLNADHDGKSVRDVAKEALAAAEAAREKSAKFITVGRFHLPDGKWHNFALGPFPTLLQGQRAGEGFTHDPKSGTGEGAYRVVPLVNKPLDAWNAIRPDQVDHKDWIAETIKNTLTGLTDPDVYKNRGNW